MTQKQTQNSGRFEAYDVALEICQGLRELLPRIKRHDGDLAKQGRRAASSMALNLKEGSRRLGRDRVHCYSIAAGSADELQGVLQVCEAWGYLPREEIRPVLELVDRELAMTYRLTHPR